MSEFDLILLGVLCVATIAAVVLRRFRLVKSLMTAVLFATVLFSVFSLYAFVPRLAVDMHMRHGGTWSEDFNTGASAVTDASRPYYPYILVAALGLATISLFGQKPIRR
jgi:hypothetical protein